MSYPSPCDTCGKAEQCQKNGWWRDCGPWLTRYRYRQKQINAWARLHGILPGKKEVANG